MILSTVAHKFVEVFGRLDTSRRKTRQLVKRIEALERSLAMMQGGSDANYDFALAHIPSVTPLMIIERIQARTDDSGLPTVGGLAIQYFRARRMEPTPNPGPGWSPNLWRVDPDFDTQDYIVVTPPGSFGMFPGCRLWAILSHDQRFLDSEGETLYDGPVYIPLSGEHQGFLIRVGGPGANPTSYTDLQFYDWTQFNTGLSFGDSRYSGQTIVGVGGANDFILPVALQLESASKDPNVTSYLPVEPLVNAKAWFVEKPTYPTTSGTHGYFVFNHATHPVTDEECPE